MLTILSASPIAFNPIAKTRPIIATRAIFASPVLPEADSFLCAIVLRKLPIINITPPTNMPPPNCNTLANIVEIISIPKTFTAAVEAAIIEKNIIVPPISLVGVKLLENMP